MHDFPRQISLFYSTAEMSAAAAGGGALIVTDVMGAGATVIAAFERGIRRVIPVADAAEALRLREILGGENVMLCGEEDGRLIEGFDADYIISGIVGEKIADKELVLYSGELAGLETASSVATNIYIGCFNNMKAVVERIEQSPSLVILCAGRPGKFSIADSVCAGMLIDRLLQDNDDERGLNDAAVTARYLYQKNKGGILELLRETERGRLLIKRGADDELINLARVDVSQTVPVYKPDSRFFVDDRF